MSLRSARIVLALILGATAACGGGGSTSNGKSSAKEPTTAKEKQLLEAKASGEVDEKGQPSWGKWRYTGERNDCFYVLGRRCFKTKKAACQAARCKAAQKCTTSGAGPARVACVKK